MPASKAEQILDAVKALLEAVPGATIERNSVLPEKIPDGGLDPEVAAQRASEYVRQGFTAVKFDPVGPYSAFDPRQLSLAALEHGEGFVKTCGKRSAAVATCCSAPMAR